MPYLFPPRCVDANWCSCTEGTIDECQPTSEVDGGSASELTLRYSTMACWKIYYLSVIFLLKLPFSSGFPVATFDDRSPASKLHSPATLIAAGCAPRYERITWRAAEGRSANDDRALAIAKKTWVKDGQGQRSRVVRSCKAVTGLCFQEHQPVFFFRLGSRVKLLAVFAVDD